MKNFFRATTLLTSFLIATTANAAPDAATAKPEAAEARFKRIEALDRAVFEAFNTCDIAKLESYFSPTLEFYHDLAGPSWGRDKFIGDVKKNICGKFQRKLVAGSLEVHPLGNWGAMYMGTHLFCKTGAAKCEGQGKFMHIWENKVGDWKITRAVSYDHRAAP